MSFDVFGSHLPERGAFNFSTVSCLFLYIEDPNLLQKFSCRLSVIVSFSLNMYGELDKKQSTYFIRRVPACASPEIGMIPLESHLNC